MSDPVYETSIADLRAAMEAGHLTSRTIVEVYIARIGRIDQGEAGLRAVLELNPQALEIADALDAERAVGSVRGPLHGVPVLLKDNIDTADAHAHHRRLAGPARLAPGQGRRGGPPAARRRARLSSARPT